MSCTAPERWCRYGLKMFQVLAYLLAQHDRVVPKDELLSHVWPDQFISDETLSTCITELRQALGDSGQRQGLIQTRRGIGYRFIAPVTAVATPLPLLAPAVPPATPACPRSPPGCASGCGPGGGIQAGDHPVLGRWPKRPPWRRAWA